MQASDYIKGKAAGTTSLVVVNGNVFADVQTFDPLTGKPNEVQNLSVCDPLDAANQVASAQTALAVAQEYQADIAAVPVTAQVATPAQPTPAN
jgi:hypothetical protein